MSVQDFEFGKFRYECEKFPERESVIRANGGWSSILLACVVFVPTAIFVTSGVIAHGLGWFGEKPVANIGIKYIAATTGAMVLWVTLLVVAWKRAARYAKAISIRLFENGFQIETPHRVFRSRYDDVATLYLGTKNKFARGGFAAATTANFPIAKSAANTMNNRLSIELKNGEVLRIPLLFACFQEESISRLFALLAEKLSTAESSSEGLHS